MSTSMQLIVPSWPTTIKHIGAISTRRASGFSLPPFAADDGSGGLNLAQHVGDYAASVERNRVALRSHLPSDPQWLNQVHGTMVFEAHAGLVSTVPPTADASVTTDLNVVCAVLTADCLPVLFCDPRGGHVGAAHAGWRGLAGGVLQRTVAAMRSAGADDIWAWLGPAIGPNRFEVGEEVRTAFCNQDAASASAFVSIAGHPGKYLANLYALAQLALREAGVTAVTGGDQCTVSQPQDYFSFRRDQRCGRMASMIWLR